MFLDIREDYAPAHKLLGQVLEKQHQIEKAAAAYKTSLNLDDKQKDVLLKGDISWWSVTLLHLNFPRLVNVCNTTQ